MGGQTLTTPWVWGRGSGNDAALGRDAGVWTSSRALLLSRWRGPSVHRGLAPSPPPSLSPACSLPTLGSPQVHETVQSAGLEPDPSVLCRLVEALQRPPGPQDPCLSLGL